ncbi:alpha-ketoglutarate-dependent dioxygenase AlkB family protein [Hymenobacter sp. GOD-10R]|uniref:alpha-ketoglutarate-dependent dioxygenase AlkB family protein n=1 Tax=Hymenobacter sp. GOD-10R TaxID=3093922 RepID=UPI002D765D47|nr:alpha-ketoglutarate-dependent dioxygenase AlkB [Hymenobacter sp. GOD-10R]WRQ28297.1 alpha-ketoglutarate-dependent dioxygenase AlkB [Hymenobacter sp. GOD-10R]
MPLTLLPLPDAEVLLDASFLAPAEAEALLVELTETICWRQEPIKLFGKEVMQPRLTAWHGDPTANYQYSGLKLAPQTWTPALQGIRQRVEAAAECSFNSVLLNLYRSGQDSMGWHADNEPELGPTPTIASVSLGATRNFRLKPRDPQRTHHQALTLALGTGSLLLMRGSTQDRWLHAVPKTAVSVAPRLNLTFRRITS